LSTEKLRILSGRWQDTFVRRGGERVVGEVQDNQIQDNAFVVVSSLLANQFDIANVPIQTPTTFGFSHIDYGIGDPSWDLDVNQPVVKDPASPTILSAVYRQTIAQSQISFVPEGDPFGGNGISQVPTNRIRLNIELGENEYVGPLREFGIFCRYGDNQLVANTINQGLIFNWVSHPLIEKDDTLKIERIIEITINRC